MSLSLFVSDRVLFCLNTIIYFCLPPRSRCTNIKINVGRSSATVIGVSRHRVLLFLINQIALFVIHIIFDVYWNKVINCKFKKNRLLVFKCLDCNATVIGYISYYMHYSLCNMHTVSTLSTPISIAILDNLSSYSRPVRKKRVRLHMMPLIGQFWPTYETIRLSKLSYSLLKLQGIICV